MAMKLKYWIFVLAVVSLWGCENTKNNKISQGNISVPTESTGQKEMPSSSLEKGGAKAFKPFNVYINKGTRDNHYIPSGFMGDGQCVTFDDTWQKECQEGSSCIKIKYDVKCSRENEKWVGVYWLNPPNNWGDKDGGFDLTGATKLVFWAKGSFGGEQIQEFTVGGIGGEYPDSDTVVIGPVILSSEWREYTIDLRGKDLTSISGGFSWSTSEDVNYEDCEFYLDSIRFE